MASRMTEVKHTKASRINRLIVHKQTQSIQHNQNRQNETQDVSLGNIFVALAATQIHLFVFMVMGEFNNNISKVEQEYIRLENYRGYPLQKLVNLSVSIFNAYKYVNR